ncbi:MAG: helix-turn-helix transcriptional regulator [Oscillospiraceae bacterium]|nr:helix-turn-helix transcriptional regulator [Oscillospiraceae bacterium]
MLRCKTDAGEKSLYKQYSLCYTVTAMTLSEGVNVDMATDFSRSLAILRKEKGVSQRIACQNLEVTQAVLSHYETGAREPGLSFVAKACDYYDVSADFLLGRTLSRDGGILRQDDISSTEEQKQNRPGKGSISSLFAKKLVVNAMSLLFEYAGRTGHTQLITEMTNFFSAAVYKIFRHFYAFVGENEKDFFSISNKVYISASNADMAESEARLLAVLHGDKQARLELPPISNDALSQEYPRLVQALYALVHQAGERAAKKLP